MSERMEPGDTADQERMPRGDFNWQLLTDIANMSRLRRELADLQQETVRALNRLNSARELLAASAEHRLPFGMRFHAAIGDAVPEVWRINDDGEYAPYGFVDTQGINYSFIADSVRIVVMGKDEVVLLTNESFKLGIVTDKVEGTLQIDDPRSAGMIMEFEDFIDLFYAQDGNGQVALEDILDSNDTPQADQS